MAVGNLGMIEEEGGWTGLDWNGQGWRAGRWERKRKRRGLIDWWIVGDGECVVDGGMDGWTD